MTSGKANHLSRVERKIMLWKISVECYTALMVTVLAFLIFIDNNC